jgi:hypothetical protein
LPGTNAAKIILYVHSEIISLPKQTHPGCSSRSFRSHLGAAPPLERGIRLVCSLAVGSGGVLRYSPLERKWRWPLHANAGRGRGVSARDLHKDWKKAYLSDILPRHKNAKRSEIANCKPIFPPPVLIILG